jgi:hypothetical protein
VEDWANEPNPEDKTDKDIRDGPEGGHERRQEITSDLRPIHREWNIVEA